MQSVERENRTFVQKWGASCWLLACLLLTMSCGADLSNNGEGVSTGEAFRVTIWNRSQFELRAIKLSKFRLASTSTTSSQGWDMAGGGASQDMQSMPDVSASAWASGERELVTLEDRPLGQEETFVVENFVSGATLSVMRERAAGAGLIEVSSATGFYPDADGYTIIVFDDTFRLLAPWSEDNPHGP